MSLLSIGAASSNIVNLTVEEFESLLKEKDVVVLDVRTEKEFSQSHIKNAINIDYLKSDFATRISQLDKNKKYLVYCATGGRSAAACNEMEKLDFKNCFNLKGGFSAWKRSGRPAE
ncbi:MAG: rhodanese-like domain-containing protein [Verrucomicrobiia bacterium]